MIRPSTILQVSNEEIFHGDGYELHVTRERYAETKAILLNLKCDEPCVLHWGLSNCISRTWRKPPESCWPAGTQAVDALAVQTPFLAEGSRQALRIELDPKDSAGAISFVLYFPAKNRWAKNGHNDYFVSLESIDEAAAHILRDLSDAIVNVETERSSWTLMHRFNMCYDLLGTVGNNAEALALIFVWLRYSAIRQLDWQRRFNTKPRELAHAQDRLTCRLAGIWRAEPSLRMYVRLMLANLGRGGEGQQVRDEILNIMHRNKIKEVQGHFIEEWHQKLHNNTTPDDVAICEAFIGFLKDGGRLDVFYKTLAQNGITRERLKSFERPIKSDPNSYGDRNPALINDFTNFLRILKAMHSGTDFDAMFDVARKHLHSDILNAINDAASQRGKQASVEIVRRITRARMSLARAIEGAKDDGVLRDLIFLDISLENWLRLVIESQNLSHLKSKELGEIFQLALRGICVSSGDAEFELCARHWDAIMAQAADGADWALHAKSVADRTARVVQRFSDRIYSVLQPKAESLGAAFNVQDWSIPLFSEEVVRGGLAFVLSLILRRLDPQLRTAAGLGGWQVVSNGSAHGRVAVAVSLGSVQGRTFNAPTVIVAETVSGNEEIPQGVTAVLTCSSVDLVSHVAVRARNAGVLFATCFDRDEYEKFKTRQEQVISLVVNSRGDVEEAGHLPDTPQSTEENAPAQFSAIHRREFSRWAVNASNFTREIVGGKSNNLNALRGKLPDWIGVPKSIAVPFGALEQCLHDGCNQDIRTKHDALMAQTGGDFSRVLADVRELILELRPSADLRGTLQAVWLQGELPELTWEETWRSIKRVWASKWNDRAFLSRRARGIADADLMMAVLIQEVIAANYAFVIHTANPMTGNRDEIYAEVVLGLGETLVGNYPGRALGFVSNKLNGAVSLLSYPGKSIGLYGEGVIFRSDSNGEDLENFAGAGLYDSCLAREPEHRLLDYSRDRLLWDRGFRDGLLRGIANVGMEVEKLCGAPQDIEGVIVNDKFYVVQTRTQVGLK